MSACRTAVALCAILFVSIAAAQHDEHHPPAPEEPAEPPAVHAMEGVLGLPMSREGSGTAWQPDATPVNGIHLAVGRWTVMLHWNVFVSYDWQGGDRGDDQVNSTNWMMAMARRTLAGGQITGRAMLSLEPATVGGAGYPILLQSGESWRGEPLRDHQHPHDLFMELALLWHRAIVRNLGVEVYAAPAGEPALGPVAFPHRRSAMSDPLAVIGHHWQDSTHIAYGVVTGGLFTQTVKIEGSWFNGREPDEDRWAFDFRAFDSWSARVSVNPTRALSLQASFGDLDSPEALEPDLSVRRTTVSAMHATAFGERGNWATAAVFGLNDASSGPITHATALETEVDLDGRNVVFGRAEYAVKSGHDLVLAEELEDRTFGVGTVAFGYVRRFSALGSVVPALGVRGSLAVVGDDLEPYYGGRASPGAVVYLQLQPPVIRHR
jgi:hypothetical protein